MRTCCWRLQQGVVNVLAVFVAWANVLEVFVAWPAITIFHNACAMLLVACVQGMGTRWIANLLALVCAR
eukprot:m.841190 g.841190  ORF g.841190 m.841190 type:complete len:69 (-) comp23469_c0_seq93:3968-4174(-)